MVRLPTDNRAYEFGSPRRLDTHPVCVGYAIRHGQQSQNRIYEDVDEFHPLQ